ncbi:hypothetical protein [Chamaesiphon sp. GL140_3_metabinner_50]|uniref:hypothetical protein n=1 Tax=Chamaesiphon sp. GL140_3_metabinner_50 TaxID=2970812 RepID=UPI0025CE784F|nr:hypothetical protein [Chamaesiphon sp. GL140_3_metabinner_50]
MSSNKICFSLAALSWLFASIPAFADTANTMTSDQITIINGSGNYSNSNSTQSITNSSQGGENSGVSMKSKQVCDIVGNDNTCENRSEQRVNINRGYYRR